MLIPEPVQRLIDAFSRLPGVGPKTASRLTFHLLRGDETLSVELAEALAELKENTAYCQQCWNITTADRTLCEVCAHPRRDAAVICVVEEPLDVLGRPKNCRPGGQSEQRRGEGNHPGNQPQHGG
jgi:recombination protein RecR